MICIQDNFNFISINIKWKSKSHPVQTFPDPQSSATKRFTTTALPTTNNPTVMYHHQPNRPNLSTKITFSSRSPDKKEATSGLRSAKTKASTFITLTLIGLNPKAQHGYFTSKKNIPIMNMFSMSSVPSIRLWRKVMRLKWRLLSRWNHSSRIRSECPSLGRWCPLR